MEQNVFGVEPPDWKCVGMARANAADEYEDRTVVVLCGVRARTRSGVPCCDRQFARTHPSNSLGEKDIKITYLPFFIESLHFIYVRWMRKRFRIVARGRQGRSGGREGDQRSEERKEAQKPGNGEKEVSTSTVAASGCLTFLLIYRPHTSCRPCLVRLSFRSRRSPRQCAAHFRFQESK